MEGDCNVYALFTVNEPIIRMVYGEKNNLMDTSLLHGPGAFYNNKGVQCNQEVCNT